jgi:hypothetical protein
MEKSDVQVIKTFSYLQMFILLKLFLDLFKRCQFRIDCLNSVNGWRNFYGTDSLSHERLDAPIL